MNFESAKDVIFNSDETCPILRTMGDERKNAFFKHFYNYPTPFSFTRIEDNVEVKLTIKEFISELKTDKLDKDFLIKQFFRWKERFDRFEKDVLEVISPVFPPEQDHYLFLRSKTFLDNKEEWEKKGIEESYLEIKGGYKAYKNRRSMADEYLAKYYLINDNIDSKILANKYSHQLYDLRKTVGVSGFANGQGYSLVPLMVKYEEIYETPIEEYEVWNGKF